MEKGFIETLQLLGYISVYSPCTRPLFSAKAYQREDKLGFILTQATPTPLKGQKLKKINLLGEKWILGTLIHPGKKSILRGGYPY